MLKLGRIQRRIDLTPRPPRSFQIKPPAFYYEVGVRADVDAVRYWCGIRGLSPIITPLEPGAISVMVRNLEHVDMFRGDPLWEESVFGAWKTPRVRRGLPFIQREPI